MLTGQGDQIGRFFACWGIVYFGNFFQANFLGNFFPRLKNLVCLTKIGWATFWAIFHQQSGHPVYRSCFPI
jgi:hypothetical protein